MIDKATAERIKETADIVEVVSDYVHLTRRGSNFMGLCPFHNERTPSFSVNRAKNFCYCFSCHKGGSPVNFIMEKEGISYQDALRQLARKYGIAIEERELTDAEKQAQSEREALFVANEWAMNKFRRYLTDTDEGRNVGLAYLYGRGVTDEAINHFRLGYAPDSNVLEKLAKEEGYNTDILVSLGLLGRSDKGMLYDRFKGRVIYPVLNAAGKVVAFGGRDLKGAKAKYINSPETPVYHKSNELYGLHQARGDMGKTDQCYLVEGYMDVIGMWQSGIRNAIASSGTALTDAQIALIHRFTRNVTLVYDGDAAGIKASMRGIDMLLTHGMNIKVLLLPDGHDPDSFARGTTPGECRSYFENNSTDFISFKARVLLKDAVSDPIRRTEAARSIVESLGSIADKIKRNIYIQECSRLLGIDEQVLSYEADIHAQRLAEQNRLHRRQQQHTPPSQQSSQPDSLTIQGNHTGNYDADSTTHIAGAILPDKATVRLERNLMRLCVRYGMVPFYPPDENPDDETEPVILLDYVRHELAADNIVLSDPLSRKMLTEIQNLRERYIIAEQQRSEELIRERESKFKDEVARMADGELSIQELEIAERELQKKLDEEYSKSLFDFACGWLGRILISHEDDSIRKLASAMIAEPYTLSRYHAKTGTLLSETDRLPELVPRALNELRAGIVEQQISEIRGKIGSCTDGKQCLELMRQLAEKQEIRKNFALFNGERILASNLRTKQ